ncbi:MAG: hypothetical protein C0601_10875 [Candidatus Muiribacterium halophilum]|uniref:TonB C-terminal domain-containing protein n=1 Tax=Muiribacterium halophilum TaxID=2053465 RepID=A0A2N5ZBU0_MUIH1|nr:MAG: hypothetical protein C0601_10875 [Candidatus Muirbacterium halophilum]
MIEFLQENREKILPLMISIAAHLMIFLLVDEYIILDFKLPQKEPEYVFVEPVVLQRENIGSVEDDLSKLSSEVDTLKEKEAVVEKEKTKKKDIVPETDISKVIVEKKIVSENKDSKMNIELQDNFKRNMVQSDVIRPDSPKALIDKEKVVLNDRMAPPEMKVEKEKINIADMPKEEPELLNEKESTTVSEIPDNVNIEIESFNKEIREVPRLISFSKPQYPDWAIEAEYQGYVKFKLAVNENGSVESLVKYQSDLPSELIAYTAEYVRKWVFRPLIINKAPIKSEILVTIVFRLEVE